MFHFAMRVKWRREYCGKPWECPASSIQRCPSYVYCLIDTRVNVSSDSVWFASGDTGGNSASTINSGDGWNWDIPAMNIFNTPLYNSPTIYRTVNI